MSEFDRREARARAQRSQQSNHASLDQDVAPRSSGLPIPDSERAVMEGSFGVDFTAVRIHTDTDAARLASSAGARAYTSGNHVVFGEGSIPRQAGRAGNCSRMS